MKIDLRFGRSGRHVGYGIENRPDLGGFRWGLEMVEYPILVLNSTLIKGIRCFRSLFEQWIRNTEASVHSTEAFILLRKVGHCECLWDIARKLCSIPKAW
jgi:hypothetical protein